MQWPDDRRRHTRLNLNRNSSSLSMVRDAASEFELESCELLNLSFTGMSCRLNNPLDEGTTHRFLIDLKGNLEGLVLVKARIRWVEPSEPSSWTMGATIVESSKWWLRPGMEELTDL